MKCININYPSINNTMEVTASGVKKDKLNIELVYSAYNIDTYEQFKSKCIDLINNSSGTRDNKRKFSNSINSARTKEKVLTIINNYWLAGHGLKV